MLDGMSQETMVNMKWVDIERYAHENAIVLLPLGVIEEHGPHLCLGTDIYTAHLQCVVLKEKLSENGIQSVIAPPFYWGICQATGGFIGSFQIRKETAKALLVDIISSLASFGFQNVFGINAHGDIEQNIMIIEAFREATERLRINARYVFSQEVMHHYGLSGEEPYLCPLKPQTVRVSSSRYQDVHGGDIETATMHQFYPHLVDADKAKSLPPTELGDDRIMSWLFGGHTKELSSDGYLGSPSDFENVDVIGNLKDLSSRIADAIAGRIV
jgi:creatinine amidohydrolase